MIRYDTKALVDNEPDPIEWVVKDVAARGALTVFFGEPSIGKSYFLLALQGILTTGANYLAGFEVGNGSALLIDAENGEQELSRRFRALSTFNGQCGVYFKAMATEPGESLDNALCQLEHEIQQLQFPSLVVCDSLRTLWPYGNEIDSKEVTAFFVQLQRIARDNAIAIVMLHHTNRQGGYAGSRAIMAVPEIGIKMDKHPRDKDKTRRVLRWQKFRLGPWPDERWIHIENAAGNVTFTEGSKPGKGETWPLT